MPIDEFLAYVGTNDSHEAFDNMTGEYITEIMWPFTKPYSPLSENADVKPIYVIIILLCVLAIITNIVAIFATCKVKYYLTLHLKLIISLSASNILIAVTILGMVLNKLLNNPRVLGQSRPYDRTLTSCLFAVVNSIEIMGFLTSLLTLLTMAVDHYIAVMIPLRYPKIMSRRRGLIIVGCIWCVAFLFGFSNIFLGLIQNHYDSEEVFHYCEFVMYDRYHAEVLVCIVTSIFILSVTYIYICLYRRLRALKKQPKLMPGGNYSLHNRAAVVTTIFIIIAFTVCLIPYIIFQMILIGLVQFNKDVVFDLFNNLVVASKYLHVLLITNCLAHPIVYAVRSKIMKGGYQSLFKQISNRENDLSGRDDDLEEAIFTGETTGNGSTPLKTMNGTTHSGDDTQAFVPK